MYLYLCHNNRGILFLVINNFYNNEAILRKEAKQGLEPLHLTKFELANNNLQQVSYDDDEHDD